MSYCNLASISNQLPAYQPSARQQSAGNSLLLAANCSTLLSASVLDGCFRLLLVHPRLRHSHRQRPDARDHANALRHADRSARVENVEQVRALQAQIEGRQHGKALALDSALR